VIVRGDTTRESNETVLLGLSAVSGATLGTSTGTLTILEDDSKLVAAAVGPGTTQRLRPRAVRKAMRAAVSWWRAHGATAKQLAGIRVVMRSMSGTDLAQATGRTITLDVDAGGWGWSTGATAQQNRMHLFSVLLHEIGHLLGHDHADGGVMGAVLSAGQTLAVQPGKRHTSRR
jgi:Zn-dependent protease with chaperone function